MTSEIQGSKQGSSSSVQLHETNVAQKRFRRIVFVVQNLEEAEVLNKELFEDIYVRRWVYQIEKAPTTGMRHAQGYVELNSQRSFRQVKEWFRRNGYDGTHIEAARGTCKQNYDYCTKMDTREDGPYEGGIRFDQYKSWELMWLEWASAHPDDDDEIPNNIYDCITEDDLSD